MQLVCDVSMHSQDASCTPSILAIGIDKISTLIWIESADWQPNQLEETAYMNENAYLHTLERILIAKFMYFG